MVRALLILLIVAICTSDLTVNRRDESPGAGQRYNAERASQIKWEVCAEVEARDYCPRPAYMMDTATSNCYRVPTVQKPYCPFP
jgi:hypothetical protein